MCIDHYHSFSPEMLNYIKWIFNKNLSMYLPGVKTFHEIIVTNYSYKVLKTQNKIQ